MLPNFIIIGGQRCATGWIAQCCRDHPEIFMSVDETRFFDRHFAKGTDWWEKTYFHPSQQHKAIGEKTANYLSDIPTPSRIQQALPDVKIICCVRNPVERLLSARMMLAATEPEIKLLSIEELIDRKPDLVERGFYSKHLNRYYNFFPKRNVLVKLFEDKTKDPIKFMNSIYEFIGVDASHVPISAHIQTKPGASENKNPMTALLTRLILSRYSPFKASYSQMRKKLPAVKWTKTEALFLINLYNEEINNIEQLIGRTLPSWRCTPDD